MTGTTPDGDAALEALYHQAQALERPVDEAMAGVLERLGMAADELRFPALADAHCALQKDPFSGEASMLCHWLDERRQRMAELVLHPGGEFWAERDVLRPHPGRPALIVEAVTAWGQEGAVQADPRLVPHPEAQ